jgi:hypothetical protein
MSALSLNHGLVRQSHDSVLANDLENKPLGATEGWEEAFRSCVNFRDIQNFKHPGSQP